MGERSIRQAARRAALDAQAGHRRRRQGRDRRIDGVSVRVLIAFGERDAAERRAWALLHTMIDHERLSLRQAAHMARRPDHDPQRHPAASTLRALGRTTRAGRRERERGADVRAAG